MKVFTIRSEHVGGRTFPWASGYRPIREMPWLDETSEAMRRSMFGFWSVNLGPPGMNIDPGGRVWSEVIGCGLGGPREFFSEKLIDDLDAAGIAYLRKTEMPVASINAKTLQKLPAPKYYVLEAMRGIERDPVAMGVPLDAEGKPDWNNFRPKVIRPFTVPVDEDGTRLYGQALPELTEPIIYRKDSWNGNPLFADEISYTCVLYCTDRLRELAAEKRWRNIQFTEVGYMA